MNRETTRLVNQLVSILKMPKARIIENAVYRLAIEYQIAGVKFEWEAEAQRRGYRKQQRKGQR